MQRGWSCSVRCASTLHGLKRRDTTTVAKSCQILGLTLDDASKPDKLKAAYLEKAKLFHPDSKSAVASEQAFSRLQDAYKCVVENVVVTPEEQEQLMFDIRHTAPQHRRYLGIYTM